MELLRITDNELKIILSKQDLNEFDLTVRTIDYNTTKTRKAMWEIFDRAKAQTGFDAAKNRIYVRLFPLSDGGCEMYVSKIPRVRPSYVPHATKKVLFYKGYDCAYMFESYEELCSACDIIGRQKFSSLYVGNNGSYILLLRNVICRGYEAGILSEYGKKMALKYINEYLNEHYTLLCEGNATEKICARQ
ncbi:MAG: adaptor protein MecA [Clostridia bacterium]|nr:adaptor protein MecA [Clostridia bacterium]